MDFKILPKQLSFPALLIVALSWTPSAHAQWAVSNCVPTSGAPGGINCATEATAAAQYRYLTTGIPSDLRGAASQDGLMPQLRALNSALGNSVEGGRQDMPNSDLAARSREVDLRYREAIERYHSPVTAQACREATLGGGLGGGSPGPANRIDLAQKQEDRILAPRTEATNLSELVAGDANQYCTAADIENKIPGCVGRSPGPLAGANLRPTSLFYAAKTATPSKDPTPTIPNDPNDDSYKAARAYINLNSPRPGRDIPEGAKDSAEGKQYLVFQRRYNSRVLAVTDTYNTIFSSTLALPPTHSFMNYWKDYQDEYASVYGPKRSAPASPSERDLINFMVHRQFGPTLLSEDLAKKGDQNYLLNRNLELQKLNAYLLLRLTTQMEQNNFLQAQILATNLDPVTREQLDAIALSVAGGQNTRPSGGQ